ncbi:hypothetical protein EHZ19_27685 [Paraburkholderia bannensis]|uniref:Transmembrane protein n=1 Tax=Paraburkholderia tropica TaxID=92647 RepID=A0AAQ1GHX7_9BURK|nr:MULTISPECIES: hypothetical protein [Paraburkholderia]QNB10665.1 hypothetical protein G5S35_03140 [Paraburkholderia tropica]RQM44659.1 hypothetical protein EHZ19_27685 [Paraburkholderia bannensis]RQN34458.1 hypothetical protein EHZ25_34610 [Paraburkholderia tropica]SEJ93392.1 hypothetical protein SAMN05216550_1119 [Paraburkholderia tropica]
MITTSSKRLLATGNIIGIASLVIAALLLIPFAPSMPLAGLDNSWRYALNVAVEHKLVFGRDVIFTFGPLASVYSTLYSPATDTLMMVGSTVFACGFGLLMALALSPGRLAYALLLPAIVAMALVRDSVFLAAPFLLLYVIARTQLVAEDRFYLRPTIPVQLGIGFATIAIIITPIVKASFAGSVWATCALAFVMLARQNRAKAAMFFLLCVAGLIVAWTSTGQPLEALPGYFIAQAPIISGYTNAMSFPGRLWIPALVAGVSLIIAIYFHVTFGRGRGLVGWCATLGLVMVLFVGFKAGMVRQDGHVFITTGFLLFIAFAAAARSAPLPACMLWIVVVATWKIVGHAVFPMGFGYAGELLNGAWTRTIAGIETRIESPSSLPAQFANANEAIRTQERLPAVSGTVDLYPTELSSVFANGLHWKPRPIFQSYSVYDPRLDAANAEHLERSGAHTVFFTFAPIDNRMPTLDDASSVVGLLARYSPVAYDGQYVRFERHAGPPAAAIEPTPLMTRHARLGERVELSASQPLWATLDIKPTLAGKLLSAAWRLPELSLELTLDDGSVVRRRFIAAVGSGGFILSPFLNRPEDLIALASGVQSARKVVAFKVEASHRHLWSDNYSVQLRRIEITPQPSASKLILSSPTDAPPDTAQTSSPPRCTFDLVNNTPYVAQTHVATPGNVLSLQGWSAPASAADAKSIRSYFIVRDANGPHYFTAEPRNRPDVALALHRPELATSGFSVMLDLSTLDHPRTVEWMVQADGKASRCPIELKLD